MFQVTPNLARLAVSCQRTLPFSWQTAENPPLTLVRKSVTFSFGRTKRSSRTLPALFTTHTLQNMWHHAGLWGKQAMQHRQVFTVQDAPAELLS